MKVKVTKTFYDTVSHKIASIGDIHETTEERAKLIVERGFGEYIEEPIAEVEEQTEKKTRKRRSKED